MLALQAMGAVVFPAHAGMNQLRRQFLRLDERVPRSCGDEPLILLALAWSGMCSPLMRG